MLRLHTDPAVVPEGMPVAPILYPFLGVPAQDPREPSAGRYDRYVAEAPGFLTLVGLEECDIVVFPVGWEAAKDSPALVEHAHRLAELAAAAGKPYVIFFWSDSPEEVPVAPSVVFRTSLYRSRRAARKAVELAMPAWSEDFVERYQGGEQILRPKLARPSVGFCGFDTPPPPPHKRLAKQLLGRPVLSSRGRAMRVLRADGRVDVDFVVRPGFYGGEVVNGRPNYEGMVRVRREYVDNMLAADYALAARGSETWGPTAGNFSYRLYEILSAGRPPLFVNTDCVLPFDEIVDWKAFTIWVDESELPDVADILVARHESLSAEGFLELQRECRRAWLEYLSPQGFFRNFHRHFPGVPA